MALAFKTIGSDSSAGGDVEVVEPGQARTLGEWSSGMIDPNAEFEVDVVSKDGRSMSKVKVGGPRAAQRAKVVGDRAVPVQPGSRRPQEPTRMARPAKVEEPMSEMGEDQGQDQVWTSEERKPLETIQTKPMVSEQVEERRVVRIPPQTAQAPRRKRVAVTFIIDKMRIAVGYDDVILSPNKAGLLLVWNPEGGGSRPPQFESGDADSKIQLLIDGQLITCAYTGQTYVISGGLELTDFLILGAESTQPEA